MPARITRQSMSDESLHRARLVLLQQVSSLGTMLHRYRDNPEITYEMKKDEDAVLDVLGIVLYEQRMRRIEDRDLSELNEEQKA